MESHRKGELTEAVVVTELIRRGIPVLRPFGDNERYDVAAETPTGSLLKLQVKTGRLLNGTVTFDGVSMHTNSRGHVYKPYRDDVDYFAVFSHDLNQLYLVPESEVGSSMALRVDPPKQPDPKVNRATDYEFDQNWPPRTEDVEQSHHTESNSWRADTSPVEGVVRSFESIGVPVFRQSDSERTIVVRTDEGPLLQLEVRGLREADGRLRAKTTRRESDSPHDSTQYALYAASRDETYLMSAAEFSTSLSLRTDDPDQVQRDSRFAEDYRLEAVWPPDGTPTVSARSAVGAVVERFETLDVPVGVVHDDTAPYDLLVEDGADGFARVAVVPVWSSGGCLRLKPDSCDGIDAFVLYYREADTCYVVDAGEFERSISLRVDEPVKADPTINWAEDYELTNRWVR